VLASHHPPYDEKDRQLVDCGWSGDPVLQHVAGGLASKALKKPAPLVNYSPG